MARIVDEQQPMNLIGYNVRKFRKERGWSQQLLADKLELIPVYICRGSISRVEERIRTVTDFEVAGLAETLGVPIEALFAQEE
jgi:transcriptional regulator with XRE-family HTH domain